MRNTNCRVREKAARAFTLIELLVVITIIAILMALLFPAFKGVQNQAKRTQAKNDVTQVVTAINAFYTEYGQYPDVSGSGGSTDFFAADDDNNSKLFSVLRADQSDTNTLTFNPKLVAFFQPQIAKDPANPRSGIGSDKKLYDPWGQTYRVKMDTNYDNNLANPYTANTGAGFDPINLGAIVWSIGVDGDGAKAATNGIAKNTGTGDDDVISWQ